MNEIELMDSVVEEHKVTEFYALFSGGHDSLCALRIASAHPLFRGVVHLDTGTGIRQTKQFVVETSERFEWTLYIQQPVWSYEQLIVRYGFPGAPAHGMMYRYLKERPLEQFLANKKAELRASGIKKPVIGLVNGMRTLESARRMGYAKPVRVDKRGVWTAVVHNWHALDVQAYMTDHELPHNPVKDRLGISGECGCGAFAEPSEKRLIKETFPEQYDRIMRWQQLVKLASDQGLASIPFNHLEWGHHDGVPDAQMEMFPMCFFCRDGLKADGSGIGEDPDRVMMVAHSNRVAHLGDDGND